MDQQSREHDPWIVQLVIAAAGGASLLDGLFEAPDKAEGNRIDAAPNCQVTVARRYSKPVLQTRDCQLGLAIGELCGTECHSSLGIARISFNSPFEEFDTPCHVTYVGNSATRQAKDFGRIAIERECLVGLAQGFVRLGHVADQVTDRQDQ